MEPLQSQRIIALSVAVALVTLAWWVDPPAATPDRVEVYVPPSVVDRIAIERGLQSTVLVRRHDGWWVGGEVNLRADEPEVRRLIDALSGLRYADPVAVPTGADPDDFGLGDPPWATVEVEGPDGRQTLELGAPAEIGVRSYVRGPEGGIFVARGDPHGLLDQPAAAFADRRLFDWPPDSIHSIEHVGRWSVVRHGADWRVADRWRGEPERVEALIRVWGSLRLDPSPVTVETDPTLVVTRRDGTSLRAELALDGTAASVVVSDGRVGTTAVEASLLDLDPRALAAERLLGLDRGTADRVTLALGDVSWEGRRNGGAWTSSLGDGPSWDVVTALAALPQHEPPLRARRAPPRLPWGRLTVHEGSTERTVVLDRARRDVHLAWWPSAAGPVAVPADAVRAVLRELTDPASRARSPE